MANHNLGVVMIQSGRAKEGLRYLKAAIDANPQEALFYFSMAKGLLTAGDPAAAGVLYSPDAAQPRDLADQRFAGLKTEVRQAAVDLFRRAVAANPRDAIAMSRPWRCAARPGKIDDAIASFRKAIAVDPQLAEAHEQLGTMLSQHGKISEGFQHYMRRAELVYGSGHAPKPDKPDPLHKVNHDAAQRAYIYGGKVPADAPEVRDMFHLGDGSRIDGPAVNPANATPELVERWQQARPQFVIIDNFLTAPALEKMRAYCAASTIWRKIYKAGYLGAALEDGFASPLLAQIVEESQSLFAPILGSEQFRYVGAFKYDSELSTGTNTHADNSTVNLNFYIAPDEASLDPESGGMVVWDVAPKDLATFRKLNGSEELVRDYIQKSGASRAVVPHQRQSRRHLQIQPAA